MTILQTCGKIAIVGKPNVGKSTLINAITGEPISIATHKAHTTRHCILGIKTRQDVQLIFTDTPGIHTQREKLLNTKMNRAAAQTINYVDAILWLTDRHKWDDDDKRVATFLSSANCPVIWCINKIDQVNNKLDFEQHTQDIAKTRTWINYILPISARTKFNLPELEELIISLCPKAPHCFPEDVITNRDEAFMISETIRANVFKNAHQEVPYATHVTIDQIKHQKHRIDILATLWVEKPSQKAILIGAKGDNIKRIGTGSRLNLCRLLDNKVNLKLWVNVQDNWSNDAKLIADQDLPGA